MNKPNHLTAKITGGVTEPKVKRYGGLPPGLIGGTDLREPLGATAMIVIEEKPGVFLFR